MFLQLCLHNCPRSDFVRVFSEALQLLFCTAWLGSQFFVCYGTITDPESCLWHKEARTGDSCSHAWQKWPFKERWFWICLGLQVNSVWSYTVQELPLFSSECCMKCIVYEKQAFLTVNNSEIVILKYLQRVGVLCSKIQVLDSLLFNFMPVWERAGILLASKVLPALPNSGFEGLKAVLEGSGNWKDYSKIYKWFVFSGVFFAA